MTEEGAILPESKLSLCYPSLLPCTASHDRGVSVHGCAVGRSRCTKHLLATIGWHWVCMALPIPVWSLRKRVFLQVLFIPIRMACILDLHDTRL